MSALVSESGSVIQTSISFQKHFIIILIISNLNPRLNLLPKVKDRINQLITEKEGIPKDHGAKNTHTNNSLSIKGNLQMLTTSVSSSLHPSPPCKQLLHAAHLKCPLYQHHQQQRVCSAWGAL